MAIIEGLAADVQRFWTPTDVGYDLVLEGAEDLAKQASPGVLRALKNKADIVRWLGDLHLPDPVLRVAGHAGGHAIASILFGALVRGGVKPELASHAYNVFKHVVSGVTGATADQINELKGGWSAKIGEAHSSVEASAGTGRPFRAPLVHDANRRVKHAHEAKVIGIDQTGMFIVATEEFDGAVQSVTLCSQALDDRMAEISSNPRRAKKPSGNQRGQNTAVESDVIHPRFTHGEYDDVMRSVREPDCSHCGAVQVARERFYDGKKDWYGKVGPEGEWLVACLRRSLLGRRGLARAEAKDLMEAITTAPVKPWKAAAKRQLGANDPATAPIVVLPHEIVEDLLALIDWQGKGEHTKTHKARSFLSEAWEWWQNTGDVINRRLRFWVKAYVYAILACVLAIFVGSWLLMPESWMMAGILSAGLGALLLTVFLYAVAPVNSIASWVTESLKFVEPVGDEFFMIVRKLMSFFLTFSLFLIGMHTVGADHSLRIVAGFVVGFLILVPIANAAPHPYLRGMLQKAVKAQTFLFLFVGTLAAVLFQVVAARDVHLIPKEYVMQVAVVEVQRGLEVVESGVRTIPSPSNTSFFRVDELPRTFWHLAEYAQNSVACFAQTSATIGLPGYRLKEVPGGYGCAAHASAYLMYETPWHSMWHSFFGASGIEYDDEEHMMQERREREEWRRLPFFSHVFRKTVGLFLGKFEMAKEREGNRSAAGTSLASSSADIDPPTPPPPAFYVAHCADLEAQGLTAQWRQYGCHNLVP